MRMHGVENLGFEQGLGVENVNDGENVSLLLNASRDETGRGVIARVIAAFVAICIP